MSGTPVDVSSTGWVAGPIERARDLEAVAELLASTFRNPWTREMLERELERFHISRIHVLRSPGGGLVGFCSAWVVGQELHINNLAVRHDERRRGAATFLLRHVLAEAWAAGMRAATLEVRESNAAARGLYGRLGFVVSGRRRGYYRNPVEDALVFCRHGVGAAPESSCRATISGPRAVH